MTTTKRSNLKDAYAAAGCQNAAERNVIRILLHLRSNSSYVMTPDEMALFVDNWTAETDGKITNWLWAAAESLAERGAIRRKKDGWRGYGTKYRISFLPLHRDVWEEDEDFE